MIIQIIETILMLTFQASLELIQFILLDSNSVTAKCVIRLFNLSLSLSVCPCLLSFSRGLKMLPNSSHGYWDFPLRKSIWCEVTVCNPKYLSVLVVASYHVFIPFSETFKALILMFFHAWQFYSNILYKKCL